MSLHASWLMAACVCGCVKREQVVLPGLSAEHVFDSIVNIPQLLEWDGTFQSVREYSRGDWPRASEGHIFGCRVTAA